MSIRYNYNQQFAPPAPCVYVSVARPDGVRSIERLPAQLGTGADVTVIPLGVVEQLELVQEGQRETIGFDGHLAVVPAYLAFVSIHSYEPAPVCVVASREEQIVLLGRDVLNRYRIVLDGPNLALDIE